MGIRDRYDGTQAQHPVLSTSFQTRPTTCYEVRRTASMARRADMACQCWLGHSNAVPVSNSSGAYNVWKWACHDGIHFRYAS